MGEFSTAVDAGRVWRALPRRSPERFGVTASAVRGWVKFLQCRTSVMHQNRPDIGPENTFFQPEHIFFHMTKIAGGPAGRFCHMVGASCHITDGLCHVPRRVLHMRKEGGGVRKSFCHVKKGVFLPDQDVFHIKKIAPKRHLRRFLGPRENAETQYWRGFRGFSGYVAPRAQLVSPRGGETIAQCGVVPSHRQRVSP